ncbi:MAG: hypothetical protein FWH26_04140 [Oscillospiraceae bacterium]|nr:hypothetical protein [Oscillospiraceae bacterium]
MKHTKRLFAALLTLALALPIALPAAAVNWDEFRITTQPESRYIKHGGSCTLSVEVNVPAGTEETYQWFHYPEGDWVPITGANASELEVSPGKSYYPKYDFFGNFSTSFYCEITAYEKDSEGTVISTRKRESNWASVYTDRAFLAKVFLFMAEPFTYAYHTIGEAIEEALWVFPPLIPVIVLASPLIFPVLLIYGYIRNFISPPDLLPVLP